MWAGDRAAWLTSLTDADVTSGTDGLVLVKNYDRTGRPPEEVLMMEKAKSYGAHSVSLLEEQTHRLQPVRGFSRSAQ